jgi:hypothetical protein
MFIDIRGKLSSFSSKEDVISVVYGATPRDAGEAKYNRLVALEVVRAVEELGLTTILIGLESSDNRVIPSKWIFNLCDGDDPTERFEICRFAQEIKNCRFTGSNHSILTLAKDKTISWAKTFRVPRYWSSPPLGIPSIVKPKFAHGSLLISEENICGEDGFVAHGNVFDEEHFYQEYLEGPEFTACFMGSEILGLSRVLDSGIISRDDKWEDLSVANRPVRHWDFSGSGFPDVRDQAILAWDELLSVGQGPGELAYGRVDLRLNSNGEVFVIDINPNAYLGSDGFLFSCWLAKNPEVNTYAKMVETIVKPLLRP